MSSTFSTQKRQTFFRRKYCFFPVAIALSPPVGRWDAAIGRPPRCSGINFSSNSFSAYRGFGLRFGLWGRCSGCARHCPGGFGGNGWGGGGQWSCRSSRSRRGLAGRALLAGFLALVDPLQLLVNANRDEFHHHVSNAQAALHFLHRAGLGCELQQNVLRLVEFFDAIGEPPHAPLIGLVQSAAFAGDSTLQLLDDRVNLFVGCIRPYNEQLFVDPHSSSSRVPRARRLNFVMALLAPSATMDSTASAT